MSFSQSTKNELARFLTDTNCCQRSELSALLVFSGSLEMRAGHRPSLVIVTESAAVARKVVKLTRNCLEAQTEIRVRRRERLQKNLSYQVRIIPAAPVGEVLQELALVDSFHRPVWGIPWPLLQADHCQWAFLRGAFLAKGSVTNPEKTYHWEISLEEKYLGEEIIKLVRTLGVNLGLTDRKKGYLLYSKNADEIAILLAGMGAYNAMLALENIRVLKEMRNTVNRQVNCETANLDKTVEAAMRQIAAIRRLESTGGFKRLSPKLRQVAEARLENPTASLKELGELLDPPVDKSTVASRLRRIEQLAKEVRA